MQLGIGATKGSLDSERECNEPTGATALGVKAGTRRQPDTDHLQAAAGMLRLVLMKWALGSRDDGGGTGVARLCL